MRIAVVNNQVPFVRGGAELQADWLVHRLREHGHQVELVRLPFRSYPPESLLEHALAARLTRIARVDRVIAMKFPSYYVPHDNKVLWILHQHRAAYDLWGTKFQDLPDTIQGRYIRDAIIAADNRLLPEARRLYVTSQVNARRMRRFNRLEPAVLYPPLGDDSSYYCEEAGDYLFLPGRITRNKRPELAVEAMRHVTSGVRLVIAGAPDDANALELLTRAAADPAVEGRVEVLAGWLREQRKLELLARCLGVLFPPYDEDFGYVTLESFLSGKPVITCTDSGGPLELAEHGVSGYVAEPDPRSIAEAVDRLGSDRARAARMGAAGRERVRTLRINWDHVVEELTA